MSDSALDLIKTYLDKSEPRVVRNAVTALAALRSPEYLPESQRLLSQTALEHPDASVRARAQDEILETRSEAAIRHCAEALADAGGTEDGKKRRRRANSILLRARRFAIPMPGPPGTWRERWRIAAELRHHSTAKRETEFYFRIARNGLVGGGLGAGVASLVLSSLHPPVNQVVYLSLFLATLSLSALAAVWLNQSATVIARYFDRPMATVVEVISFIFNLRTVLATLLVALVISGMWSFSVDATHRRALLLGTYLALSFLLVLALVRLGTVLAEFVDHVPWQPLPWVKSLLSGLIAGLALTGLLFWAAATWPDVARLAAWVWFFCFPAYFGIGFALAHLEAAQFDFSLVGRTVAAGMGLAALIVLISIAARSLSSVPAASPGDPLPDEVWLDGVSSTFRFGVEFPQWIEADVSSGETATPRVLRLWNDGRVLAEGRHLEAELDPGIYRLEAAEPGTDKAGASQGSDLLEAHQAAIRRLARKVVPPQLATDLIETAFQVTYVLNSKSDQATRNAYIARGWSLLERGYVDQAFLALDRAAMFDRELRRSAVFWEQICWFGSLSPAGDEQQILKYCERATDLDPNSPQAWQSLMLAQVRFDDFEGALASYEHIKSNSDFVSPRLVSWEEKLKRGEKPVDEIRALRPDRKLDHRLGLDD